MNETRLKGNFIGGVINFGYSLNPIFSEINGKQVQTALKVIINNEEAAIVREIFTEYASGKKAVDIARSLNEKGVKKRGNIFQATSVYTILRQEKYTGIYRIHGMSFNNIYPQIVPLEIYEIVKARIDANKYGKHPPDNVEYFLKGKIYCGYCGKKMTSFTGTSKSGKISRYYKCHKTSTCEQSKTIRKEILEQVVTQALNNLLCSEVNFTLLIEKVTDLRNGKLHDMTALKIAEKELEAVEKSLSNLLVAIEAGLLTETTKERLLELETSKRELKEKIAVEKSKEIKPIDKNKIMQYVMFALSQPTSAMIDLLVQKVVLKNDAIDLYLKCTNDIPPDDRPRRGRPKKTDNPERILSDRGFLFMQYTYTYQTYVGGRNPIIPKERKTETKSFQVCIYI